MGQGASKPDFTSLKCIMVECPVCMDVLNEPKQLHCGHTLCNDCIDHMIVSGSNPHVQCPVCRKFSEVPVDGFATNFAFADLLSQIQGNKTLVPASSKCPDKTKSQQHHAGIICVRCGKGPIVGIRYKCMDCQNYDLCSMCHNSGTHSQHPMLTIKDPNDKSWMETFMASGTDNQAHVGIICDGCETNPIVESIFSLARSEQDACSELEALLSLGTERIHTGVTCDVCGTKPIIGARFKCFQCPDYDLCRTCETTGTHGQHMMVRISDPSHFGWKLLFKKYREACSEPSPTVQCCLVYPPK